MKKLQSIAFCALVTPVLSLGAGSVLAQQSTGQGLDRNQGSSQHEQGAQQSNPRTLQSDQGKHQRDQSKQRAGQSGSQSAADRMGSRDQSRMQNKGYLNAAPANAMHSDNLIGATVKSTGGEDVGSVDHLIIDQDGQILAIVVGVGGFLGMGQRDVAIGWDDVTKSGASDDLELRVDVTRESLRSAPEFKARD